MKILFFTFCILLLLLPLTINEIRDNHPINYFLKQSGIKKTPFHIGQIQDGKPQVTNLDDARGMFVLFRQVLLEHAKKNWQHLYDYNRRMGKLQRPRKWEEFPCPLNGTRSEVPPTVADEVRPGDIDIIAAIGDSLSAGNGIISETILEIPTEFRSMSFSGGGRADWRTVLTLPNILKVFNPNLYGFATDDVVVTERKSFLNIAEPMIMSRDLVFQVQIFIQRMRKDPRIDMKNHWKLLTIFVGNNDICSDMCHHDNMLNFLTQHEQNLRRAFTILRDNVPRLLVNMVPVTNMVTTLRLMHNIPLQCYIIHHIACHCIVDRRYDDKYFRNASEFITRWQNVDEFVASLPEFQTKDFAILYQPFSVNIFVPYLHNGNTDLKYLASDCFHFSQLGHAALANNLWNNMLQAWGKKKSALYEIFVDFECPTEERPFIATISNSKRKS